MNTVAYVFEILAYDCEHLYSGTINCMIYLVAIDWKPSGVVLVRLEYLKKHSKRR